MTPLTGFVLAAAALVLAVLAILLPPLLRSSKPSKADDRRAANLEIFRDQLSELERERAEGSLAEVDFNQSRLELQRRLLEEVKDDQALPAQTRGRKTALVLILAIPLAASAGYALLGTPRALDPVHAQSEMSTQQIDTMLDKLVERLKANPDDSKGWVMLARSYKALGRYTAAAEAFSHGGALVDGDPTLLADYAEVLLQTNNGNFDGKPGKLVVQALKINPNEPQALFLAGAAAMDRKDFPSGIGYWNRLLPQLDPDSEDAKALRTAIDKARQIGGLAVSQPAAGTSLPPETISGKVTLSGNLTAKAEADDLLFVFARTEEGSRMPLAVIRRRAGELPFAFNLDDSMAIPGGQAISSQKIVSIEARIAKSGKAQSSPGDLYGIAKRIKPGSKNVSLVIDSIQP